MDLKIKCECKHSKKMHLGTYYDGECCIIYRKPKETGNLKSCYCTKFVKEREEVKDGR